jgi:hypothetical protein
MVALTERGSGMRLTYGLLIAGAVLFTAGAVQLLTALYGEGSVPAGRASALLGGAAVCLTVAAVRLQRRVDWDRIMAEQRLWESGALGRAWLRIRQRGAGP